MVFLNYDLLKIFALIFTMFLILIMDGGITSKCIHYFLKSPIDTEGEGEAQHIEPTIVIVLDAIAKVKRRQKLKYVAVLHLASKECHQLW